MDAHGNVWRLPASRNTCSTVQKERKVLLHTVHATLFAVVMLPHREGLVVSRFFPLPCCQVSCCGKHSTRHGCDAYPSQEDLLIAVSKGEGDQFPLCDVSTPYLGNSGRSSTMSAKDTTDHCYLHPSFPYFLRSKCSLMPSPQEMSVCHCSCCQTVAEE